MKFFETSAKSGENIHQVNLACVCVGSVNLDSILP